MLLLIYSTQSWQLFYTAQNLSQCFSLWAMFVSTSLADIQVSRAPNKPQYNANNTQRLGQISSSKEYSFPNVENDVDCIKTWGAQRIHLILKIVVWEIWCVFLAASFSHCVWSLKDVRKTSVKTKAAFFSTSREITSNTFSYKVTRSFSLVRVGGWLSSWSSMLSEWSARLRRQ